MEPTYASYRKLYYTVEERASKEIKRKKWGTHGYPKNSKSVPETAGPPEYNGAYTAIFFTFCANRLADPEKW